MDLDVFFILDALIVLRFYCYLNAIVDRPSVSPTKILLFCNILTEAHRVWGGGEACIQQVRSGLYFQRFRGTKKTRN